MRGFGAPVPSILVFLSSASVARAQEPLATGDRVRLTAPSYRLDARIGTLRSVSNDRIEFRPADSTQSVEVFFRAISLLDRSAGTKPSLAQGLLYGLGGGLVGGGILGAATCKGSFGSGGSNCTGNSLAGGAAVGLAVGAILGFTVLRTDRWVRVVLPTPTRPLGLAVSLGF